MLQFTTTPNLILKAVKQFPYHETRQPNCFAVIQDTDELTDENLKKLLVNYESNEFWARDWAAKGANPSEINREFPAVFVRSMEVHTEGEKVGALRDWVKYAVGIVDISNCATCKKRTIEQVKSDLHYTLRNIALEIRRQTQYQVLTAANISTQIWASQDEITQYQQSGILAVTAKRSHEFSRDTKNWSDIGFFNLSIDNAIAAQMTFEVNVCTEQVVFNYSFTEAERQAFFECQTCP